MNFPLFLFIVLVVTGLAWLLDWAVLRARRPAGVAEPWWVEYSKSFFPVILLVFAVRSFVVEPFKIPSGSMIPTLWVGDFILVNKFDYGIRLPIINTKIIPVGEPHRGDVMVFRYPGDPSVDYIKRVVGLPGDTVTYTYATKSLTINGKPVPLKPDGTFSYVESGLNYVTTNRYLEKLGRHVHSIILESGLPAIEPEAIQNFPHKRDCVYGETSFTCKVPAGEYFMMGDNRDRSNDSRYWGFVPERNIVGKAFLIWWNFDALNRIGKLIS